MRSGLAKSFAVISMLAGNLLLKNSPRTLTNVSPSAWLRIITVMETRFSSDAVQHVTGDILISGVTVMKENSTEPVLNETLRGFKIHTLHCVGRKCNRPGKVHVIR